MASGDIQVTRERQCTGVCDVTVWVCVCVNVSCRVEKLTEVIAELRHPSSLSQPTSNPVAESTQILPPLTSTSSNETVLSSQSLATTILPRGGEDSQMSCNVSVLELRDDPDTLYKCLCVACALLKELKIQKLSPTLLTLVDNLVCQT